MKVAINQPYLSPYSGYYSLIAAADIFVIYDCVQFIRRGRIHRSQIHASTGFNDGWLTLPIQKAPQNTAIIDIGLRPLSEGDYAGACSPLFTQLARDFDTTPYWTHPAPLGDFLHLHLETSAKQLNINSKIVRSSQMFIDPNLHGQDRILEICKHLGASEYLNLPGGRFLYEETAFQASGIRLSFLDTSDCSRFGYLQSRVEGQFARFSQEAHRNLRAL